MPWITDSELKNSVAAILRTTSSVLPDYWDTTVGESNQEAYDYITAMLADNYTVAQLNTWAARKTFNRRIALCIIFEKETLPEGANYNLEAACKAREELMTLTLVSDDGLPLEAGQSRPGVNYGVFRDDTRRGGFDMDTTL
jgi:hypothetical protein